MVTLLMISLFYLLLKEGKYRSLPDLTVFALLQAVWANCHGLFVIGPFMAGCYWVGAVAERYRDGRKELVPLTLLIAVLVGATLVTPYGVGGWEYAMLLYREASSASAMSLGHIGELGPTFSRASLQAPAFWFFLVLLLLAVAAFVLAAVKRTLPAGRLLIVAGLGFAAMTGRRNMPLFALVAAPFIAEQVPLLFPSKGRFERILAIVSVPAIFLWCLYPLSGKYYLKVATPARFGLGTTPSYYPYGLPRFLERVGFRGNIYNSDGLGGFFLYQLYPKLRPLYDGRWELYDRQVLEAIRMAPANPRLWQQLVASYDIRGVLLHHASVEARELLPRLARDQGWRLVYVDHAASFWVRSDVAGSIPAIDLSASGTLPAATSRVEDALILDHFLRNMKADDLRLKNLERILSFGWNEEATLASIGILQINLGRFAEAESTFQRLIASYPKNATAQNELKFLAYRRGGGMVAPNR